MKIQQQEKYLKQLREGEESGLTYFYNRWYKNYYYISWRRTTCDLSAAAMVQEAFLRLWMVRESMESLEQAQAFIKKQLRLAYEVWYRNSGQRFYRSMLRLDGVEDAYEFIWAVNENEEDSYLDMELMDEVRTAQGKQLRAVLPNLPQGQQKVLNLLLSYGLDYERVSWHLGGISCYVAAQRVEKTINLLKSVLINGAAFSGHRINKKEVVIIGGLSEEQARILSYRYELSYSFEEIAELMNMRQAEVQLWFVQAQQMMRKEQSA